jgi:hypothetical protein
MEVDRGKWRREELRKDWFDLYLESENMYPATLDPSFLLKKVHRFQRSPKV